MPVLFSCLTIYLGMLLTQRASHTAHQCLKAVKNFCIQTHGQSVSSRTPCQTLKNGHVLMSFATNIRLYSSINGTKRTIYVCTVSKSCDRFNSSCLRCYSKGVSTESSVNKVGSGTMKQHTDSDEAISFLSSKAHKIETHSLERLSRQKFNLSLGVFLFGVILYFGFFREYGSTDKKLYGFLTKDISDKIPDDVQQRLFNEVEQSHKND